MSLNLAFFGLQQKPFSPTPDPHFLYPSPGHREGLAQLLYGVQEHKGFTLLTGEVGTGKTTLLRTLLTRLDGNTASAFVFDTTLPFEGLLEYILEDFGVAKPGESHTQRLIALNRFLIVHFLGLAELSVYAVNYSIASIVHVVAMVVSFILIPRVNEAWNLGDEVRVRTLLKMATEYYLFGVLPIGLAIGLFYPQLLTLLAGENYSSSLVLIMTLVCFMILLGFEQILTFATLIKGSHFSLGVRALALGINVLLNLLLIKKVGLVGSVVAGNVALATIVLLNTWRLKAVVGYVFPWREVGELLLAGLAMLAAGALVTAWLPSARVLALIVGGTVCGAVYLGAESLRSGSVFLELVRAFSARRALPPEPSQEDYADIQFVRQLAQETPDETMLPRSW